MTVNQYAHSCDIPRTAVFEMTYACNLECLFCYCPWCATGRGFPRQPELKVEEWKSVIDLLANRGVQSFTFSGGEPLLKDGLADLLSYARAKEVLAGDDSQNRNGTGEKRAAEVYIISNGHLLTDGWLGLFEDLGAVLAISLPGITTYEAHTGRSGSGMVLQWMAKASRRNLHVVANVTATRRNLPELFEIIAEALLHGASSLLLNRFLPGGRGLSHIEELWLTREATLEAFDVAEKVLSLANREGSVGTEVPFCIVGDQEYRNLHVSTGCGAGVDFFVIGPSGNVRVCNHSEISIGHWTRLDEIVGSPYWQRFRRRDYFPNECKACGQQSRCAAGCREMAHIIGGDLASLDPIMDEQVNGKYPDFPRRRDCCSV